MNREGERVARANAKTGLGCRSMQFNFRQLQQNPSSGSSQLRRCVQRRRSLEPSHVHDLPSSNSKLFPVAATKSTPPLVLRENIEIQGSR